MSTLDAGSSDHHFVAAITRFRGSDVSPVKDRKLQEVYRLFDHEYLKCTHRQLRDKIREIRGIHE